MISRQIADQYVERTRYSSTRLLDRRQVEANVMKKGRVFRKVTLVASMVVLAACGGDDGPSVMTSDRWVYRLIQ